MVQAQDFEAIGKGLVTQLVARQFDQVEPQFDEQMKAALPVSKLPEVWDSLLAQAGPFKSIVSTRVTEKQGLHAAIVTCEFERATLDAKIFMDAQGQVKGLFFEPASNSPGVRRQRPRSGRLPSYAKPDAFHERDTHAHQRALGIARNSDVAEYEDHGPGRGVGSGIGPARPG